MKHAGQFGTAGTVLRAAAAGRGRRPPPPSPSAARFSAPSPTVRRGVAGAKVTILNEGTGADPHRHHRRQRRIHRAVGPDRPLHGHAPRSGFKALALSNIEVGVDQRVRIDLKLEVGAMTESVSIQAETPLVQTSSSELGHDGRQRTDRSAAAQRPQLRQPHAHHPRRAARHSWRQHRRRRQPRLARLGVVLRQRPAAARQQLHARRRGQQRDLAPDRRRVPERRRARRVQAADEHLLGGIRPLARRRRQPPDQVWHQPAARRAFEFHRNDALDANNFFNNKNNRDKPDFKQNQFGGTIGGAIFKDKTFFFTDYQGHRETQGQTALSTVPTLKMRSGDFSELNRVIYDPTNNSRFKATSFPGAGSTRSRATS